VREGQEGEEEVGRGGHAEEGLDPPFATFRLPRGRHNVPPEQVAESQRWRLLGATAEVLAERGYARIRLADVAARAGVSRGTFYEFFEDLPACLLAAHEMVAECVCDLVESACGAEGEWEARLRAALEEVLLFLAEEPALAHLLGTELAAGVPVVAAAHERMLDRLAATGAERRSLDGAFSLVLERVAKGETADLPELAPQLTQLIRRAEGPARRRRGAPAT
jgi:AcrR family transcriptional regulator